MSVSNVSDKKKFGEWKTVTLTAATTSAEVDLGYIYQKLLVLIPTLDDAATTTVHVASGTGETYYPLYMFDTNAVGDYAQITDDLDYKKAITYDIGGAKHIKVVCDATQTSVTFYVRGINP